MVKVPAVQFTPQAAADLSRLDKAIAQSTMDKIKWLSENFALITPESLKHGLKGKYKLRVGNWRVIYELNEAPLSIIILFIGHRREVYKR